MVTLPCFETMLKDSALFNWATALLTAAGTEVVLPAIEAPFEIEGLVNDVPGKQGLAGNVFDDSMI